MSFLRHSSRWFVWLVRFILFYIVSVLPACVQRASDPLDLEVTAGCKPLYEC